MRNTRVEIGSDRRDYISRWPYSYKRLLKVQLQAAIEGAYANLANAFGVVLSS
ncbi:hypothetical protein HanXRQr2_Chr08g0334931 [Helianthus annuus]|uniref:Uncharacterized protein n=1 Tax=Helianthus annuus TaxID=4232 RepID=A0A9K3IDR8_HELAN|nr:hypothetical protein HanXRQr2_Chr08g0334931 [Helianthus annuus]